jgi:hypothetical protein
MDNYNDYLREEYERFNISAKNYCLVSNFNPHTNSFIKSSPKVNDAYRMTQLIGVADPLGIWVNNESSFIFPFDRMVSFSVGFIRKRLVQKISKDYLAGRYPNDLQYVSSEMDQKTDPTTRFILVTNQHVTEQDRTKTFYKVVSYVDGTANHHYYSKPVSSDSVSMQGRYFIKRELRQVILNAGTQDIITGRDGDGDNVFGAFVVLWRW